MSGPTVTVRYFAAAQAAAGTAEELVEIDDDTSVSRLIDRMGDGRPELARVLARCSFLHDEIAVRDRARAVTPGSTIDVLPPFAGG